MILLIFDIDNTLTKTSILHQQSFVSALRSLGITEINQKWEDYEHLTDSYILKYNYEKTFNKDFNPKLISELEEYIRQSVSKVKNIQEVKGAKSLIDFINPGNEYAYCLATGSVFKPAKYKLDKANIIYNEALLSAANDFYSREEIVLNAINLAKKYYKINDFDRVISIGDGVWDLKTAHNLGIEFIGVGEENRDFFQKNNKKYVPDFENFIDIINE